MFCTGCISKHFALYAYVWTKSTDYVLLWVQTVITTVGLVTVPVEVH